MAGSLHNKSVNTDFAVFLNTFLIISTVIVFAVLVFISYQNMYNQYLDEAMVESTDICADIAVDYADFSIKYPDVEIRNDLMDLYLDSIFMTSKGEVYIVDSEGIVYYTNTDLRQGVFAGSEVKFAVASANSRLYQNVQEVTASLSKLVTCTNIGNTGLYVVHIAKVDFSDVISEFMTIMVYPVIVSLAAAIALLVGFTGIAIRPLRAISKTITKVSEGDLSARVDEKFTSYGDRSGMLTLSSDLTDMAGEVNIMIETLENQENDRAMFISSVAHDIRTPLTSINGFVTAMTDGTIPPELHEKYLGKIKYEVDRIRTLVVSMTEASSLSHVDPSLMEEFDLKNVVEDILSELEPQLGSKRIKAEARIDEEGGTMVYGEVHQLNRVLINIVTNAIKFTPEDGKIIISSYLDKKEKARVITVEDSGPGVEPAKRSKVFDSFYKADPSRKQEGFGLGLYICKQILAGHNQLIRLDESPELGGARFIFSFPIPPDKE